MTVPMKNSLLCFAYPRVKNGTVSSGVTEILGTVGGPFLFPVVQTCFEASKWETEDEKDNIS